MGPTPPEDVYKLFGGKAPKAIQQSMRECIPVAPQPYVLLQIAAPVACQYMCTDLADILGFRLQFTTSASKSSNKARVNAFRTHAANHIQELCIRLLLPNAALNMDEYNIGFKPISTVVCRASSWGLNRWPCKAFKQRMTRATPAKVKTQWKIQNGLLVFSCW